MIQIGELFNKIIPLETLLQMPLPFVHRLRDLQIQRREEAERIRQQPQQPNGGLQPTIPPMNHMAMEELIDELS